jgi:hypothetical protein
MRRRIGIAVALAGVVVALAVPAGATADHSLASNCSPTGDYCTNVFVSGGHYWLDIKTFSFRGAYELCVRVPGAPFDCEPFTLRSKPHGIYEGRVDLFRHFGPALPHGSYAARWRSSGSAIGPTLHFHVG